MTPNQTTTSPSNTLPSSAKQGDGVGATPLNINKNALDMSTQEISDDPMLTTDCPSYSTNVIGQPPPPLQKAPMLCRDDKDGSEASSQKITIESIKDDDDFDDDRSSVVTESSDSDSECGDHVKGTFHEELKRSADTLAVDAINCASNELQTNTNGAICVKSEIRAGYRPNAVPLMGKANNGSVAGVNKGYVMSEVGKPSRLRNGKEVMLKENGAIVPVSSVTTASPLGPQTTAIFNDSTDITLGNKTFITGSLTIKQYIKDSSTQQPSCWKKLSLRKKVGIIAVTSTLVTSLLVMAILFAVLDDGQSSKGNSDEDRFITPIDSTIGQDQTSTGITLRTVTRGQWVAQPPEEDLDDLQLPVHRVIIAHTASENCTTQSECVFHVRNIQNFHIESQHFSDIGYNWLIGGDGSVYEGRGWDKQGAHTRGYNVGSICIAFIGTYTKVAPSQRMLNVAKLLLAEGVKLKKLDKDYKLYGHRQFIPSESPGKKLYDIIVTWDHWASNVDNV